MRRFVALLAFFMPSLLWADGLVHIDLYDRSSGEVLPVHEHRGKRYVVGEPGHRYEIAVRSRTNERLLAVTSVDGVNVITGETASERQSGYVLAAYDSVTIDGWRKNLDEVATFYFTSLPDSYASRTGRPDNVGVIGVALFRERVPCCDALREQQSVAPQAAPRAADESSASSYRRDESKLGTGHGERMQSGAQYVEFERASMRPEETIIIYYDSERNLIARGVLPKRHPRYTPRGPKAFPNGFVPDP